MDAMPSFADAPFHAPPDVVLDLPVPLSVNRLRKIDWTNHKKAQNWRKVANGFLMVAKTRKVNPVRFNRIPRFHLTIMLDDDLALIDLDNSLKLLIDYLHHVGIVADDSPKHLRKLTVEWGHVPIGCRVTVRPCA